MSGGVLDFPQPRLAVHRVMDDQILARMLAADQPLAARMIEDHGAVLADHASEPVRARARDADNNVVRSPILATTTATDGRRPRKRRRGRQTYETAPSSNLYQFALILTRRRQRHRETAKRSWRSRTAGDATRILDRFASLAMTTRAVA